MPVDRPRGREKNVTGGGLGVHRRGDGLGGGPVGGGSAFGGSGSSGGGGGKRGHGFGIIVLILLVLLGGGGTFGGLLGGGSGSGSDTYSASQNSSGQNGSVFELISDLLGDDQESGSTGSGSSNSGFLNREEDPRARAKYTTLRGNGKDTVTVMVYLCGTDLESKSGMATKDLQEMAAASLSDKVNLLVYTGGCRNWQNDVVSSSKNQIYKIQNGGLKCLVKNDGDKAMTDPATLSGFIRWSAQNYPADRNILIFWDHGGGSVSGYGYDEKNAGSGSMSLAGINRALRDGGLRYDFIGFDACLMATTENALMLSSYADYMIASEESEPGIGWYYTNWLTKLSKNTSMDTLDVGKQIVDDFISACNQKCAGQQITLSVTDLAELGETLADDFTAFSRDTSGMISGDEFRTVSTARSNTREFAKSSKIDQIDLVHFALNMGTDEGRALADTLLNAVKYNRTSNMTNAYGLSVYFPSSRMSYVSKAAKTYEQIGVDDSYTECIREFASMQASGQAVTGGTGSPVQSLFGDTGSYGGGSSYSGSSAYGSSAEVLSELLQSFLTSGTINISDLSSADFDFFGRSVDPARTADYISENSLDTSAFVWKKNGDGKQSMVLSEDQWGLVTGLDLNMFYDDGEGYVDLGLDNVYELGDDGSLIADVDGTWLSINNQPVAYYHTDTTEDGEQYTITGYVPALLNGSRVKLILIFNNDNPGGFIAGAQPVYDELTETTAVARGLTELKTGDRLDFLCDFYSYNGEYQDSYKLGDQMEVTDSMTISNTYLGSGGVKALYRFKDIYSQYYWTPEVPVN